MIHLHHHCGSSRAQPGFYHIFGADSLDMTEALHIVRLYFNVRQESAANFIRVLSGGLDRYRIPFNAKITTRPSDFSRVDTSVLYTPQRVFTSLMHVLSTLLRQIAEMLDPCVPYFTRPLCPGIGFAEEPDSKGSFGSHRSELVARAILRAVRRQGLPAGVRGAFSGRDPGRRAARGRAAPAGEFPF